MPAGQAEEKAEINQAGTIALHRDPATAAGLDGRAAAGDTAGDAAGAYQVGSFSCRRWAEWNGRFRDDVRRFWRGDPGMAGAFASRLCGSADIYQRSGKEPLNSINFITCHDGFTLNDLVSYAHKHNQANGEGNRDGSEENFSANYGTEGESKDAATEAVRQDGSRRGTRTLPQRSKA